MKTHSVTSQVASGSLLLALILTAAVGSLAQGQTSAVLALSKDGYSHKVPSSLKVAVFTQDKPMQFQLCFENAHTSYAEITLKDAKGHKLYNERVYNTAKYVSYFDMSKLEEGLYVVEVANKLDKHRYQIEVGKKMVQDLEVKPYRTRHTILANKAD